MSRQLQLLNFCVPEPAPAATPLDNMIRTWPQDSMGSNRNWLLFWENGADKNEYRDAGSAEARQKCEPGAKVLYLWDNQGGFYRIGVPLLNNVFSGADFRRDVWEPFIRAVTEYMQKNYGLVNSAVTAAWRGETRAIVEGGEL